MGYLLNSCVGVGVGVSGGVGLGVWWPGSLFLSAASDGVLTCSCGRGGALRPAESIYLAR